MSKFSRRDFLRMGVGAAGSVSLGMFGPRAKALAAETEMTTALVIGSGIGGAIAALRLAQAGIDTIVLERGRRWNIQPDGNTFSTFDHPDGRSSWLSDFATGLDPVPIERYTGVLELIDAGTIQVRNGAGVGGGTLAYNAIIVPPRREVWLQNFPADLGIDFDEMNEVYFPRFRQMIDASPIPDDILATSYYQSTRVNLQQALNAGFSIRPVYYGVDWNIVRKEINTLQNGLQPGDPGYARPSAIAGQSWFGLNSGAKTSVDHNYLKLAEATGRVDVRPLHLVRDITQQATSQFAYYEVSVDKIDTSGNVVYTKKFLCTYLFLAAGATGTPPLLVRAQARGTLPGLRTNTAIGQFWGNNGDFIAVRGIPGIQPGKGGPCGHIYMEELDNPIGETGLVELVVPSSDVSAFPNTSLYVGMSSICPAAGYFGYDAATDSVNLNWPAADDPVLADFVASSQYLLNTMNAANSGTSTEFFAPFFTAHPVGGAILGQACDAIGRVKGQPRLYVVDGAMVPVGSLGVNPSQTIGGLAERNIERIISADIFGAAQPPTSAIVG
jgi:cholesterol oxidase